MKVMVVLGTRPELIRLSRIIRRIKEQLDLVLVHTGQNYARELNEVFFTDLEIPKPQHYLGVAAGSLAETMANIIVKTDRVFEAEKPDALLVLGDTNSSLCVIPAKRRKIPIFHFEAGNRCFDDRVPEETNRRIVDHTADVNMTYSSIARENLLREGLPMDRTFCIGSPMFEVLQAYADKIARSDAVERLGLKPRGYFLLSCHREENVDDPARLKELVETLGSLQAEYDYPILFSVHPRTRKRMVEAGLSLGSRIQEHEPFNFTDYIALQKQAFCVLSDSGTLTEEASLLGLAAVNLRETHERQEGMEKAAAIMAGFRKETVLTAVKVAASGRSVSMDPVPDYQQRSVSEKVLRLIVSYTDYVQRTTWRRNI